MNEHIEVERDAEGYLVDPEAWNEEIAAELAAEEGVGLNDEYWPILHFMREYWQEHRVAPDVRHVVDFIASSDGADKRTVKTQLFRLFPYGYVKQACKIAGMIKPRAWSTG